MAVAQFAFKEEAIKPVPVICCRGNSSNTVTLRFLWSFTMTPTWRRSESSTNRVAWSRWRRPGWRKRWKSFAYLGWPTARTLHRFRRLVFL